MRDELKALFLDAAATPYDMRSPASKSICASMTAFCWKFLSPYSGGKPEWFDSPDYLKYFQVDQPEYAARVYELMWFANLAHIATTEPELLDWAAARLEVESRSGDVPTRSNLALRGCVEYRRGNYQMAKHFISRAHSELIPGSVISPFFAYSRSACLFDEPHDDLPTVEVSHAGDPCILISGDAKYVVKYLPNYVDSVLATGANEALSVHLRVIRTADASEMDEAVEQVVKDAQNRLGACFEVSETVAPKVRDTRSWFAAERFLFAKSLLPDKGQLIITDLDYGLRDNPAQFLGWANGFDVCVLKARGSEFKSFFPWLKVQAGTVVVSDTPAGASFLDDFSRYFHAAFVGAGWNWGIDQNALGNALDNLGRRAKIGNINDIRQPFYIPRALKESVS